MMRAPLLAIVLSSVSAAVCAQPANGAVADLESCFKLARAADAVCSDPANDAVQRLGCLQKARAAQLECLKQIPPESSARSAPSEKADRTAVPKTPPGMASPELPIATVLPNPHAAPSPDKPAGAASSDSPAGAASAAKPAGTASSDQPALTDKPAAAATPNLPARTVDSAPKPPDTNWVVSATTSPVDNAPLITAAIRLPFSVKHAPNTLAIRCRGRRTELLVRTEGAWRASRAGEVEVEYQINNSPSVRLPWTASTDGRTASYKNDSIGLLQSLPEGARLKISVVDGPGPSHQATFQLAGLDAVREKIAAKCMWPPTANKASSERR
jgi:hypothetical protein